MRRALSKHFVLVGLALLGCKERTAPHALQADDTTEDLAAAFDPEDLAVLFPIDRAIFAKAYGSHDAFLRDLDAYLVPLSKLMSKAFYEQSLLALVTEETEERNILSEDPVRKALLAIPIDQWRVAATRFIPCALPRLPVPAAWLYAQESGTPLAQAICRPRIRLSIQRFGATTCTTCGQRGTSDDKALHIIYDYVGTLAPAEATRLHDVETKLATSLAQKLEAGTLTQLEAVQDISSTYSDMAVQGTLDSLRKAFVSELAGLRQASASGLLSLHYRAKGALPRYRAYIEERLSKEAVPSLITQNFVPTREPGFTTDWVFAQ